MSDYKFISLRSVYKSYDKNTKILENFNLDIEEGSFISILGPSGSGKSTVLNLIGGFIKPDKGKILINGIDVKDISPNYRPTATVFQSYALFPHMNVFDNIAYGLKKMFVHKEDVDESLYLLVEKLYGESVKKASKKLSFLKQKIESINVKKQKIIDKFEFLGQNKFFSYIKNALINSYELKLIDLDYWISYWEYYSIIARKKYVERYIKRPLKKQEINDRVLKIIDMVGLNGKETCNPLSLSGGQQQRTALARAIITEPQILLLDEPLSALDESVREKLQLELKKLHKRLNITFILITHNQEEALMLSDKIVVLRAGKIEQIGAPSELYDAPINTWVANFMGKANIFSGIYIRIGVILVGDNEFTTDVVEGFELGEEVYVMIRPEDYDVVDVDKGIVSVQVIDAIYKGQLWEIKCKFMDNIIYVENIDEVAIGKKVGLIWDSIDVHVMKK